jgi:toxin secretion/phage lysis holin
MVGSWAAANPFLVTLLYAMSFDILLGVCRAFADKALNSDICGKGMRKKASMLILVLAIQAIERVTGNNPVDVWLTSAFIAAETLSILENAKLLGAPIPDWFNSYVEELSTQFRLGDSPRERLRILKQRKGADPVEQVLDVIE